MGRRRVTFMLLSLCAVAALPLPAGASGVTATRVRLTLRIARADASRRHSLRVMHRSLPPPLRLAGLTLDDLARAAVWQARRAASLAWAAQHPPHLADWLCIERHEAPGWHTDTGNGYFGGLQLDRQFQLTYGGWLYRAKGTADHWTPLEQIWTAEYARTHGRGFAPWPNTARACGLL